ncbi:MAG: DUF3801 domain-containing protein [Faecalibacterium sp.]|jgi:hypothetical protein|nr:DUF3801 domain-containing protein [Faecalibacterium sp.]
MSELPQKTNFDSEKRRREIVARQIEEIKRRCDILEYVRSQGYELQAHGNGKYHLAIHDSLVLDAEKQTFRWYSRDKYGDVIALAQLDLATGTEVRSPSEARRLLLGQVQMPMISPPLVQKKPEPTVRSELIPPAADPQYWKRIYGYLIQQRCISPEVVHWLVEQDLIYPDSRGNLVYLDRDAAGKATYAAKKGSTSNNHFRWVDPASNFEARCTWNMAAKPTTVFVTEAAVDAWSIMSLFQQAGVDFRKYGYISLECCFGGPLIYHLKHNPQIRTVYLGQDTDAAGIQSRADCRKLLQTAGISGIAVKDKLPATGKDWNDMLQSKKVAERTEVFTMEADQVSYQALRVELGAAKVTGKAVWSAIRWFVQHKDAIHYGKQSIKKLNRQGKELAENDLKDADLQEAKRRLKQYSVDFAIVKQKDSSGNITGYSLWFKAQDVEQIYAALTGIIHDKSKEKAVAEQPQQADVKDVCHDAKEKAEARNAEKEAHSHACERGEPSR